VETEDTFASSTRKAGDGVESPCSYEKSITPCQDYIGADELRSWLDGAVFPAHKAMPA